MWTVDSISTSGLQLSLDKLGYLYAVGSDHYEDDAGPDAVLSKYDASGNVIWSTHFSSTGPDTATDVSADGLGNVFVTGQYWPIGKSNASLYVNKYTAEGQMQWTTLIPTNAAGLNFRIAADDLGNIFVGGSTDVNLAGRNKGSSDAFIAKLNSGGDVAWIRQFGTPSSDDVMAIAADGLGNAYLGGSTIGSLLKPKQGFSDAFIYKYDANGNIIWNQQLNDPGFDAILGLAVANDKTLLALGGGLFPGTENDAFLMQFDDQGQALRTELFGAKGDFYVTSVDSDHHGGAFVTGTVSVSWGGDWQGASDAYLARFTVPEPSGSELARLVPLALMSLGRFRRKRIGHPTSG
ncbi:MAG: SBBP repeat-containing protein [Pirellulales bacterium]